MLNLTTREPCEVRALREELSEQPIGVLVGAALPRILRMREVDLDSGRFGEEPVLGHLLPSVVGERAAHLLRQGAHLAGERAPNAGRVLRAQGHQERGPGRALHQCTQGRSRPSAHEQVAFPVAGNRPIRDFGGSLFDADHVGQLPPPVVGPAGSTRSTPLVPMAQGREQLPPELPSGQHVQVRVDGFVRDAHRRIIRILRFSQVAICSADQRWASPACT